MDGESVLALRRNLKSALFQKFVILSGSRVLLRITAPSASPILKSGKCYVTETISCTHRVRCKVCLSLQARSHSKAMLTGAAGKHSVEWHRYES